jgi:hypothetical protein
MPITFLQNKFYKKNIYDKIEQPLSLASFSSQNPSALELTPAHHVALRSPQPPQHGDLSFF